MTSQGHQNWSEKEKRKKERGNKKKENKDFVLFSIKKDFKMFFFVCVCVCVIDFSLFH